MHSVWIVSMVNETRTNITKKTFIGIWIRSRKISTEKLDAKRNTNECFGFSMEVPCLRVQLSISLLAAGQVFAKLDLWIWFYLWTIMELMPWAGTNYFVSDPIGGRFTVRTNRGTTERGSGTDLRVCVSKWLLIANNEQWPIHSKKN